MRKKQNLLGYCMITTNIQKKTNFVLKYTDALQITDAIAASTLISFKSYILQRSSCFFCSHHDCLQQFITGHLWFSDGYISLTLPRWSLSSQAPATHRVTKVPLNCAPCFLNGKHYQKSFLTDKVFALEELRSVIVAD